MAVEPGWCLVLGASSGFGAAAARAFARAGLDVIGVHLDRKITRHLAEEVQKDVEAAGRRAHFFNVNAADPDRRAEVIEALREPLAERPRVRVLLHSLAFGTLLPFVPEDGGRGVSRVQMGMTLDVMASSLVAWTQELAAADLLEDRARIFAMTSEGGGRVWPAYGPVAAAKAALESIVRQLAVELAPRAITVNALCAGVTDTPALRKIPGHEALLRGAQGRNPRGRLTTPDDVVGAMLALADAGCGWVSGNVIRVDGGEGVCA